MATRLTVERIISLSYWDKQAYKNIEREAIPTNWSESEMVQECYELIPPCLAISLMLWGEKFEQAQLGAGCGWLHSRKMWREQAHMYSSCRRICRRLHPLPMNGIVARIRAFPYKSTFSYTNSVCAVAHAAIPFMGGVVHWIWLSPKKWTNTLVTLVGRMADPLWT